MNRKASYHFAPVSPPPRARLSSCLHREIIFYAKPIKCPSCARMAFTLHPPPLPLVQRDRILRLHYRFETPLD